jgi:hypothetical protein
MVISTGPEQFLPVLDQGAGSLLQLPGSGKGTAFFPNIVGTATLGAGSSLDGFDFNSGSNVSIRFSGSGTAANTSRVVSMTMTPDGGATSCIQGTSAATLVENVNINVSQNGIAGIEVDNDPNVVICNSTVTTAGSNSPGIRTLNDGQVTLINNTVTTTGDTSPGVVANDDGDVTITSCKSITTSGANSPGISASNDGSVDIENCTITTNGPDSPGIELNQDRNVIIANNTITTTAGAFGVLLQDITGTALISGNTINISGADLNQGSGIEFRFGSNTAVSPTITGNTITTAESGDKGIRFQSPNPD